MKNSISYKTVPELIEAIKMKRKNIQEALNSIAGFKLPKPKIKEVQMYISQELMKPKLDFKLSEWQKAIKKLK